MQFREDALRLLVIARAVVGLAHPVAGQLVEAVRAGDVVGRGPEERGRVAVGAAREELLAPQEVGLGIIVPHVGRQLVDVVVGRHRAGVVLVHEGRQGHVAVDHVAARLGGPALDVVGEAGGVLIEVEGQLGVVERSVLRDLGIVVHLRGVVEALHGRHLVVRAQVGVGQQVVGHLSQRIRPAAHLQEIFDGAGVVVDGVEHRARVEEILAVHILVREVVVVFAGLLFLALDQVGFRQDARHALAALRRERGVDARALADHEVVVLLVEFAVDDVEVRQRLEAAVGRSLPEIGLRPGELLVLIQHDAGEIAARRRVVRLRERLQQGEEAGRFRILPQAERTESAFEDVLGEFFFLQVFRAHVGELGRGLLILLPVEQDASLLEVERAGQARRRVAQAVARKQVVAVDRLHFQGTEDLVSIAQRAVGHGLETDAGLFVHPVSVKAHRLLPGAHAAVRGGSEPRGAEDQRKQGGQQCFQPHKLILFLK